MTDEKRGQEQDLSPDLRQDEGPEPDTQDANAAAEAEPDADLGQKSAIGEPRNDDSRKAAANMAEPDAGLEEDVAQAGNKPLKSGRGLAWFALLVALIASGGAGFLVYERFYENPVATLRSELTTLSGQSDSERARLNSAMEAQNAQIAQTIADAQTEQRAELATVRAGVIESLNEALLAAPPSQRQWKLAEAEYLLRIGNHRVLMEHDSQGAVSLFLAADQILAEIDDFSLHEVRAVLADEIIALRAVPTADLQGIYLRLEALKGELDQVALKAPEFTPPQIAPQADMTSWQQLSQAMEGLVRVRDLSGDETLTPLLAPQEQEYLELNLRLALQQAQLAALRRQQGVYVQSLDNVGRWLSLYGADESQVLQQEVADLQALALAHPLPDVSASLRALRDLTGGAE